MVKIVVLDGFALNPNDLDWTALSQLGELAVYDRTLPHQLMERLADADVALTNKTVLNADTLQKVSGKLRYVGVIATGYNVVDVAAARQFGITVTNVPAYSTYSVAQMVFAHLLNLSTHVADYSHAAIAEGRWAAARDFCFYEQPIFELAGKTFGILGMGQIGTVVAAIASAMGMRVIATSSKEPAALPQYVEKVSLDELFRQSDVLSLHCPLTPSTHHVVNAERLAQMRKGAILINTGRGPLIDELAVADALHCGHLGAFAADVLSEEPANAANPLLSAPRVQLTPHIAWATFEARKRLMRITVENVAAFLRGEPQNVVS